MSQKAKNILTNTSKQSEAEVISANSDRNSLELAQKRSRAHVEHVYEQMLTLTQLFNQLIQDIFVRTTSTADFRTHHPRMRSAFDRESEASRTSPNTYKYKISQRQ